jgi:uncharacterized protein
MNPERAAFIAEKRIAVVGVSRHRGFGNAILKALRKQGYEVFPVNSEVDTVEGERCYRSVAEVPAPAPAVVVVVPPAAGVKVIEDCARAGVKRVWLQQGAESPAVLAACKEKGIEASSGACIIMHAAPTGLHSFHRWIWKITKRI